MGQKKTGWIFFEIKIFFICEFWNFWKKYRPDERLRLGCCSSKLLKPGGEISEVEKEAESFAKDLRSLTVSAFKTNEFICEKVLAYAPVPGEQKGCVDLMETTGGKSWSL